MDSKAFIPDWPALRHRLRQRRDLMLLSLVLAGGAYLSGADWLFCLGGLFVGMAFLCLRASDQQRAENAAAKATENHRHDAALLAEAGSFAAFTAIDLPSVIFDADGTLLFQNPAASLDFGEIEAGLHLSAKWRSPNILDMMRETIKSGRPNQIEHSEFLPSERVFIVRIAPLMVPQRARPLYLMTFRDISELRRIDRMRSDFVANASHELRTPLASLRGFIETLLGPARNDARAQERFLNIMLEQATRMSRLVDDLLSLSRLELKAHLAPAQKVELAPVLTHVRDSLAPLAGELDVDVRLHLPDGPVEVVGERDELIQVFENLIENACKYGQEGKLVDVTLRRRDGVVEVAVTDKGPGIAPEHVPRLTERFYRVSVADSRSKKGTGLGLAIVKHILTRHRARLIVRSDVGQGTEFTVRF
ncbi:phosphate regulon sensor histidine kinase PhoR [Allorhizobium undicola]|uniref:phosphate regulon sensor histidine kinase PhoR n=1 Tax=Allorhizobium undicola TaxID=78527 RepID=UPI0005611D76|nr:phosphate regulon sensor histidine kinase PhoR [Allorhizobium undicola]